MKVKFTKETRRFDGPESKLLCSCCDCKITTELACDICKNYCCRYCLENGTCIDCIDLI